MSYVFNRAPDLSDIQEGGTITSISQLTASGYGTRHSMDSTQSDGVSRQQSVDSTHLDGVSRQQSTDSTMSDVLDHRLSVDSTNSGDSKHQSADTKANSELCDIFEHTGYANHSGDANVNNLRQIDHNSHQFNGESSDKETHRNISTTRDTSNSNQCPPGEGIPYMDDNEEIDLYDISADIARDLDIGSGRWSQIPTRRHTHDAVSAMTSQLTSQMTTRRHTFDNIPTITVTPSSRQDLSHDQ